MRPQPLSQVGTAPDVHSIHALCNELESAGARYVDAATLAEELEIEMGIGDLTQRLRLAVEGYLRTPIQGVSEIRPRADLLLRYAAVTGAANDELMKDELRSISDFLGRAGF